MLQGHPKVESVDGEYEFSHNRLYWKIDTIDSTNSSGTLEFSLNTATSGDGMDSLFPVNVKFTSKKSICGVIVNGVVCGNDAIEYTITENVSSEEYKVI